MHKTGTQFPTQSAAGGVRLRIWIETISLAVCRCEREATYCNSMELSGMDSTLPHFKDSRERLLDV